MCTDLEEDLRGVDAGGPQDDLLLQRARQLVRNSHFRPRHAAHDEHHYAAPAGGRNGGRTRPAGVPATEAAQQRTGLVGQYYLMAKCAVKTNTTSAEPNGTEQTRARTLHLCIGKETCRTLWSAELEAM